MQLGSGIQSFNMNSDKIYLGMETGSVTVFLHLGKGDIVQQQVKTSIKMKLLFPKIFRLSVVTMDLYQVWMLMTHTW